LFGALIGLLLLLMVAKKRMPELNLGNKAKIICGVFIGILAGLFGIGGGPVTVPILLVLFGLPQKSVSATSSYITFVTALASVISNVSAGNNDLSLAILMIPGGIVGAQIGTFFNKKVSEPVANGLFSLVLVYLLIRQFI
jgi:uncharacterized membrane protein YfcA